MRKFLLGLLVALSSLGASAKTVVIDFESLPSGSNFKDNFELSGFRFTTSCHYDVNNVDFNGTPLPDGNWLGFDSSGCNGAPKNPNYEGPTPSNSFDYLYITPIDGQSFDLISFTFAGVGGDELFVNGVRVNPMALWDTIEFNQIGITSILMWDSVGFPLGFDNLRLEVADATVPEPSALVLVVIALLLAGGRSRVKPGSAGWTSA